MLPKMVGNNLTQTVATLHITAVVQYFDGLLHFRPTPARRPRSTAKASIFITPRHLANY